MKVSITSIVASACLAAFMCAGCEPKPVVSQPAVPPASNIDPKAAEVLKSMSETLDSTKSFSCRVFQIYDTPDKSGKLLQFTRQSDVVVIRPDKMAVTAKGYDFEKKFWYSDRTMTVVDEKENIHASEGNVPDKIWNMLDFLATKYHLIMPLSDVLFPQSYKSMTANVTSGQYLGTHKCGKYLCHHLGFEQADIDWQVWIDAGDKPLLRKLMIIYKTQPGMPRYTSVIRNWDLSPKISKDAFTPKIPAGSNRVTFDKMLNLEKGK